MGYNVYQGQIIGPFTNGQDLYNKIQQDCESSFITIWHLGIQSKIGSQFKINNKDTQIGKTGIYEIGNV